MLVFTHSPSPPVENEEKEDAEKGIVEEEEPELRVRTQQTPNPRIEYIKQS